MRGVWKRVQEVAKVNKSRVWFGVSVKFMDIPFCCIIIMKNIVILTLFQMEYFMYRRRDKEKVGMPQSMGIV